MKNDRGFTLTEMLVVLGMIAGLAGIVYPIGRSMLARSREAACLSHLRGIGIGLQGYLQEHAQQLPELAAGRASKTHEVAVIETVLLPYVDGREAFHCPEDHEEFEKTGSSYFWNSTQNGVRISKLSFFGIQGRPEKIPLVGDKEAWHPDEATNFLYADSSASNKMRFSTGN